MPMVSEGTMPLAHRFFNMLLVLDIPYIVVYCSLSNLVGGRRHFVMQISRSFVRFRRVIEYTTRQGRAS